MVDLKPRGIDDSAAGRAWRPSLFKWSIPLSIAGGQRIGEIREGSIIRWGKQIGILRPLEPGPPAGPKTIHNQRITMKTLIIIAAGVLVAGSAFAQGSISAPVVQRRALPPANPRKRRGGSTRGEAWKSGQMFNPIAARALRRPGASLTASDEDNGLHQRNHARPTPMGLRLFSFAF